MSYANLASGRKNRKSNQGFTLIELVLVIIILGIMSVGISSFISISTQTYLTASNRDELIGNARFVIQRLSRELRNAVPNSIRIENFTTGQCLQFTPIVASSSYIDIPVVPEPASDELSVIPFIDDVTGADYQYNSGDLITIYPLKTTDIYAETDAVFAKIFQIVGVEVVVDVDTGATAWNINLPNDINFEEDSPTQRLYITNQQVSYCTRYISSESVWTLVRFTAAITSGSQTYPSSTAFYMAGYLTGDNPFSYLHATLQRNALVQIQLHFTKDGENYVFDHEVHINNVP